MQDSRNLEQVYRSAVSGLYSRIRHYYDFLYRKYGSDGLDLIAEMSRDYGLSVARRARITLKNNDLDSVANYLIRIFNTVGWGRDLTELVEISPSKVIIKANECPLHFSDPVMCRAHTTMEKTVVEELNTELIYRIGKSIPAGDSYCEHIIELKKTKTGTNQNL